ncbi:MAG TPA: hypothetical protein VGO00_24920 [Kofleriaceae bacterium]|jgi:hypothetical protein|nr:hypothetical protein [Kofleriaceae bacterium]
MTVENLVIGMIFGSLVSAVVATYRRRRPLPWLAAGAMCPLISLIVLLALRPLPE